MAANLRFALSRHQRRLSPAAAEQFVAVLGAAIKRPVRLLLTPDYDRLLEGILVGGVDAAWMPPLVQARAVAAGALPAAVCERNGRLVFRSALLVREQDPYREVEDLLGARAAWSDPSSASGHLFPRRHLMAHGIDPIRDVAKESFFGTPAAAGAAVVGGHADLCACYVSDRAALDRDLAASDVRRSLGAIADGLRVLDITGPIPPDGFVLGAPIVGWTQAIVRDGLLGLHLHSDGKNALRALADADRLVAVTAAVRRSLIQIED